MPDTAGNSSATMSMHASSSQQQENYTRSLDSTDGPHNNHNSNTQLLNPSLNYQSSVVNNNHTHPINNTSNHISNNDQNNNPNSLLRRHRLTTNDISSPGSDLGLGHEDAENRRDLFADIRNGGGHWSQLLRQVVLSCPPHFANMAPGQSDPMPLPTVPLQIQGGSENGHFAVVGHMNPDISQWIAVGYLQPGDVLLDIQGQQVRHSSLSNFLLLFTFLFAFSW